MIDLNREEFEKLPEVADSLSEHIYFGSDNLYHSALINFQGLVNWLNGAWYAFQEQQKKLDCCREENKALLDNLNITDGYKLVPVEATDSQWAAGIDAYTQAMHGQDVLSASSFFDIYKAMIGAAP